MSEVTEYLENYAGEKYYLSGIILTWWDLRALALSKSPLQVRLYVREAQILTEQGES